MAWWQSAWVRGFITIVLFIGVMAVAFTVAPAPITKFKPNGRHLGDLKIGTTWYNIFQIVFGENVDKGWVTTNSFIQFLLLPFIAIWAIMYAILGETPMFRNVTWFNPVMAFIIALVSSSLGFTVTLMRGYLTIAGTMGISFFGFILFLAILFWGLGRLGEFGVPLGAMKGAVERRTKRTSIEGVVSNANVYLQTLGADPAETKRKREVLGLINKINMHLTKGEMKEAESDANTLAQLMTKPVS